MIAKYRGWTIDTKREVKGYYFVFQGCCNGREFTQHLIGDLENHEEVDPKTVSRFTGMHDKNGKEIYFDSDVVDYTYTSDCGGAEGEEFTVRGIVVLDLRHTNSVCVLEKRNGRTGGLYHFTARETRNIEVIGNATENPALLEEQK